MKLSDIFDESLYFDTANKSTADVQIFIGGRGVGKTYSTLRNYVYDQNKKEIIVPADEFSGKFLYIRNTAKQIKLCASPAGNPFKKINAKIGLHITPRSIGEDVYGFYPEDTSAIRKIVNVTCPVLGYGIAMNTSGNMRSVDFSDVDYMLYEEFIDQSPRIRKLMENAGNDFAHLRETVGRNREMEGQKPLQIKLLSNSITLDSPILLELGVANTIAHMIMKGQEKCTIPEKSIYIQLVRNREFEEAKQQTSLYQASKEDSLFLKEALRNEFCQDNFDLIRKKAPINEYVPRFTVGKSFTVYRHKSRNEWFISARSIQNRVEIYQSQDIDRLQDEWGFLYKRWILSRTVFFDNYATKLLADSVMKT